MEKMAQTSNQYYPSALTIAGSDSGGGAGIQADLRTFAAFGVYGCSAITALTSQNPLEVTRVDSVPVDGVAEQIERVLSVIDIKTVKTGMLHSVDVVEKVAEVLSGRSLPLIVDPVMVSTSGARLLEEEAVEAVCNKLMPLAAWITPNVPEAEILTGMQIKSREDMVLAAVKCSEKWDCGCILKAGHLLDGKSADDIVAYSGKTYFLSSPLAEAPAIATHGTGCTLSSALTAALALEFPWKQALRMAKGFVYGSLSESIPIGKGVSAMYPPSESHMNVVDLKRIN